MKKGAKPSGKKKSDPFIRDYMSGELLKDPALDRKKLMKEARDAPRP